MWEKRERTNMENIISYITFGLVIGFLVTKLISAIA